MLFCASADAHNLNFETYIGLLFALFYIFYCASKTYFTDFILLSNKLCSLPLLIWFQASILCNQSIFFPPLALFLSLCVLWYWRFSHCTSALCALWSVCSVWDQSVSRCSRSQRRLPWTARFGLLPATYFGRRRAGAVRRVFFMVNPWQHTLIITLSRFLGKKNSA